MTSAELAEARILITGGTSGIGLATAEAFVNAGSRKIVLAGRDEARGAAACRRLKELSDGTRPLFVSGDVTVAGDAARIVAEAEAAFGGVDVLVNSAGGDHLPKLFHEQTAEGAVQVAHNCLDPVILMCRAVLPSMYGQRSGAIINVASDAAKVGTPGEAVIGAAMAGIVMFSRGLSLEAKRLGVRVNAITPSIVRGTRTYERIQAEPFSEKLFAKAEGAAHLGVVEPDDIAPLIVFLASAAAARLTGQAISVNGGISAA
ncbi:SDR family NAD(P)-dependent oxidoreductase [Enterovirga sp. CN4-39]|uniref:SDR family NAD(P)-dependent oxidoreductase n=1 Tax=Enterovirga sp. CN4-39 TaxID=3400910 RepID=UPI003BFFF78E